MKLPAGEGQPVPGQRAAVPGAAGPGEPPSRRPAPDRAPVLRDGAHNGEISLSSVADEGDRDSSSSDLG